MFEELGFEWKEEKAYIQYSKIYWKHWVFQNKITICFWKLFQKVSIYDKECLEIDMEILQAINKQVEELGWISGEDR